MGAGASSSKGGNRGSGVTKKQKSLKKGEDKDFKTICRLVFTEADRNQNGKLDNGEVSTAPHRTATHPMLGGYLHMCATHRGAH